ncbi:MAG: hypothetical protein DIZ80_12915 [endosymbiont of Galathealinum brachiosum]|uniref:Prolyl 3,4-dihydroxylase TPA1/OFD1 N-terminal domain-containing protein n=1 Tax=endosymbiont of Galathealinum brachiosum TaxID=2200906 RepID=A0A370D7U4_9GAMM|nr:MAG: hypothetical protein DIZ80_12915 [endosymbiont of Galathealinum brachiosum]
MLNKKLDLEAIKDQFNNQGYVAIENILEDGYVKRIAQSIYKEITWELCYLSENGPVSISAEELSKYTPQQSSQLNQNIMAMAQKGFSYFYYRSDLVNSTNKVLQEFYQDLRGEEFLNFCRNVTGELTINNLNGQLASFSPGCFLRKHTDKTDKEKRAAAYVFNFTPIWNNDWGGLLHMLDGEQTILDIIEPFFNSLTIFKVPALHYVSQVANYARGKRYTATGWLLME